MYTLRRISSGGAEMNQFLGDSYTLVSQKDCPDGFKNSLENHFRDYRAVEDAEHIQEELEKIYAFVGGEGGKVIQPLYKNQKNCIMSSDGSTFANLSLK